MHLFDKAATTAMAKRDSYSRGRRDEESELNQALGIHIDHQAADVRGECDCNAPHNDA